MAKPREKTRYPGIFREPSGNYTTYVTVDGRQRWKVFGKNVRDAIAWRAEVQSRSGGGC
jgi:hypothetical protein